MSLRIAHVFASSSKKNSGDFMIGIATKLYFREKYFKGVKLLFDDFDCRNAKLYTLDQLEQLNKYDYILVGGGGLILPDTSANKVSCWQWVIDQSIYSLLKPKIYVISVGYNLFYGQTLNMPNRDNNEEDDSRLPIFKENITTLINKAEHFSLRHHADVRSLLKIIGDEYKDKIRYEMCPTVWYVQKFWKPSLRQLKMKKVLGIEIKADRQWRRFHKITGEVFYEHLANFVVWYNQHRGPVAFVSHDGSMVFYRLLAKRGVKIPLIDNSCSDETKIRSNYGKLHTIISTAGHSQMIAHGLGIRTISLVTHPKLKNFCDDISNKEYILVNNSKNLFLDLKKFF